jgi:putative FmdB family regulatory protein
LPTYNYRCKDCGHEFSEIQKISDEPFKECPECEGELEKIFKKPPGIQFKGPGFYSNT